MSKLILASVSPQRRDLLSMLGIPFQVVSPPFQEPTPRGEDPLDFALQLAIAKARSITPSNSWVLGADTVVATLDGEILGKPVNADHAGIGLQKLSGRTHHVITGVCLLSPHGASHTFTSLTEVDMVDLSESDKTNYLESNDWQNKAGGYAIQGNAARFVRSIRGSYTNVVGLPLAEVDALLKQTVLCQAPLD